MKIVKERIEIFKTILPYISKYKFQWILLLILKIGQKVPVLIHPLILKIFVDIVLEKRNLSFMYIVIVMCIGAYLLETLLKVSHRVIDNSLFNKITQDLRTIVFNKYMQMPMKKHEEYQTGDMVRRLNFDIDMVKFFLIGQVFDYISYIILAISSLVLMFMLEWHFAIVACMMIPVSLYLSAKFENEIEELAENDRQGLSKIEDFVQQIKSNWKEVKVNRFENIQEKKFENILLEFWECKCLNAELKCKRNIALDTKEKLVDFLAMYIVGGILSAFWGVAVGIVMACVGYYDNILQSVREIMQTNSNLKWMKPSINRVVEILDFSTESVEESKVILEHTQSVYQVRDINFKYETAEREIIQNKSFDILRGEKVLLEGESGCGKSTLMQILAGENFAQVGDVFFEGIDIRTISENELYNYIRKIDQNTYFMNISVREFLSMANADGTLEEMKNACIKVNIWNDLEKISPDLEFHMGENGMNFSKGQKQKLALARLFLSHTKVIMLDEAFSAIDVADKIQIVKRLFQKYKNDTIICAAHDEEIKGYFDKIIQVNNLNIVKQ